MTVSSEKNPENYHYKKMVNSRAISLPILGDAVLVEFYEFHTQAHPKKKMGVER